jgi:hypothetical protein
MAVLPSNRIAYILTVVNAGKNSRHSGQVSTVKAGLELSMTARGSGATAARLRHSIHHARIDGGLAQAQSAIRRQAKRRVTPSANLPYARLRKRRSSSRSRLRGRIIPFHKFDSRTGIAPMRAMTRSLERKDTHELVFPTDVMALAFGILIFSQAIFLLSKGLLSDPDTYWHITAGHWILAERTIPRQEIFSHTALGHPWLDVEWLAQIILYLSYDSSGWHGLILLSGLVLSITFVLLYEFLARELRPTVALGASAIAYLFASPHYLARPHILTLPIIVLWTAALARAADENRRPSLWLLPLMVVWANLHGGFTIGLVMAAGFGLDATIAAGSARRRRVAAEWSIFGLGALFAGCITPYGYQSIVRTYLGLDLGAFLNQIGEWRAMDAYNNANQELILLCLLALALSFGVRIGFIRVLMVVGLLHLGLRHLRGLPIFALTLPLIIAHPLQEQFAFLRLSTDPFPLFDGRRFRLTATAIAVASTLVVAGLLGTAYSILRPTDAPDDGITPAAAIDHVMKANITGPVFNSFDFGGYLIFRGIPTFIDGRTLPFGKEFALKYLDAVAPNGGSKLEQLADAYKVSWTLVRANSASAFHFDLSPHWRRIYADEIAVVHVRR